MCKKALWWWGPSLNRAKIIACHPKKVTFSIFSVSYDNALLANNQQRMDYLNFDPPHIINILIQNKRGSMGSLNTIHALLLWYCASFMLPWIDTFICAANRVQRAQQKYPPTCVLFLYSSLSDERTRRRSLFWELYGFCRSGEYSIYEADLNVH